MYACQWHFDISFGKQKEVLDIMKRWDAEMAKATDAPKPRSARTTVGHIGVSPSHVVNEYVVDSVSDWEKFMSIVATGRFKGFAEEMAKYILPGSQHWEILRIVE
jgi:hypothetical protein